MTGRFTSRASIFLLVASFALCLSASAQSKKNKPPAPPGWDQPNPIGAWFGIARPCTPPPFPPAEGQPPPVPFENGAPVDDFLPDETICDLACDGEACAPNAFPLLQVTMIPTLLADGTVLADDFGELFDNHTTAHGKWEYGGRVLVDGKYLEKYQATFIWFKANQVEDERGIIFGGSIRPRFVTFFDRDNPDFMRGYIQPFSYDYTEDDGTIGRVNLGGGPFPDPNPADPLPEGCTFSSNPRGPHCLGTLHFNIQRIPAH
jgi:hypothetical protein